MFDIGYMSPDWGMDGWYAREDRAQQEFEWRENNAELWRDDCLHAAKESVKEFYSDADANDKGLEDDWHECLLSSCYCNDMRRAMKFLIEYEEDFTRAKWVLENK